VQYKFIANYSGGNIDSHSALTSALHFAKLILTAAEGTGGRGSFRKGGGMRPILTLDIGDRSYCRPSLSWIRPPDLSSEPKN